MFSNRWKHEIYLTFTYSYYLLLTEYLANTVLKIFTQILFNRLFKWVEYVNVSEGKKKN